MSVYRTFVNDFGLAALLKCYNCNLERVKVLSRHEIEVGVWVLAQFALSLCQTICTKREAQSFTAHAMLFESILN